MCIRDRYIDKNVESARVKLERSIATVRDMKAGEIIKESDLHMLSPGDGFKWDQLNEVLGKELLVDLPRNEVIYPKDIR